MQSDPMTLTLFAPLFGAILAFLFPRAARALGLVAVLVTGGAVVWLARAVLAEGAVTLALGGWAPPLGISLRADGLSVAMLAMTAAVGLLVSLGALDALRDARQTRYFWPLWLLLLTGMNGVYLSTDIFNLYVMIEVIALAAVGLTVLSGTRAALRAGLEYMYASILGALLFLMGVGFVYLQLGRLDFAGLITAEPSGALSAALALMVVGLALKTALFPLHFWLPAAHANATAPASALLSGLVVKAALYIFLRLTTYMPLPDEVLVTLIGTLGAGAVIWGGIQALRAERLKLLVAWSTVVQIGLIFIAFARAGQVGLTESWKAAALLILAHGVAKAAMFLAAGRIKDEVGHDTIRELDKSAIRPTLAQFTFALAAISLIGLPPSLGFIGKWSLMEGAMAAGYWHWVGVTMIGTLLSVAYFSRVLAGFLRFDRVRAPLGEHQGWALADVAPLTLAVSAIGLGLLAAPILSFIELGYPFGAMP
ncbi:oxidoreductase [Rhodobacteraceae bacterium 2376]|uniref:Oxidoreductase n=1 Tax=Rhabdonatronobacter sediminivivens TaxID=2743469 RepID=A0A7Z0KZ82_9RHOB|nr:proton-conducting transporter membrane subunit [Rhabdonatronobacter sediminivivens]NYS26104.1 oxidoreductase [Rhabdonatronobacter sediminivivens]